MDTVFAARPACWGGGDDYADELMVCGGKIILMRGARVMLEYPPTKPRG